MVLGLDNFGSHKGRTARTAIHAAGPHLVFLPPKEWSPRVSFRLSLRCRRYVISSEHFSVDGTLIEARGSTDVTPCFSSKCCWNAGIRTKVI